MPTKNSGGTIRSCLESVLAQDVPVEVIVVDNHSEDETVRTAKDYGCTVILAGPERSRQRNIGAHQGAGEWLLFVDSDMVLHPGVASSCLKACRVEGGSAAIIPEMASGEGFLARCRELEKFCYLGDTDIEAARFFNRKVFERVGGYDERIHAGGEDWDLSIRVNKAGLKVVRAKREIVHLEGRISLTECFRMKRYYGLTIPRYRAKHPEVASKQMRLLRPAFLRQWRTLIRHPLLTAGLVLLKTVEFAGVATGLAISKRGRDHPADPPMHASDRS